MALFKDPPTFPNAYGVEQLNQVCTQSSDPPGKEARIYIVRKPVDVKLPSRLQSIRSQVPLAPMTSLRVGGQAQWYLDSSNVDDVQAGLEWACSEGLPITFLGSGSNMLVSDKGLAGLVIASRHLRQSHIDSSTGQVTVGTGVSLVRLAWQVAEQGLTGLEWAVGIPGTVGGAVVMNAGAHGHCTAEILMNARVMLPDGTMVIFGPEELEYGYRTSKLQQGKYFVVEATFQLNPGADPEVVKVETTVDLKRRQASQPYHRPSCGSVFRNPTPHSAGQLIEESGLKGYQIGNAQVSELHANFILNCGGAKAQDVFQLIRTVQQRVEQQWSIHLEPEVKILGEF